MDFEVVVQNGTIVNHDKEYKADVGISKGKIVAIGENLKTSEKTKVVDAKGCFVMPGGVDPHVHMSLPFMGTVSADDFYTGSRAALSGGTTMLMDFAIPPKNGSLMDCYNDYRKRADEQCCMDYGLHMGVSTWDENKKKELTELVKNHGINSFKFFMAYKGALMMNDSEIIDIMDCARKCGAIAQVHAENGDMVVAGQEMMKKMGITQPCGHPQSRPAEVEAEATARCCRIADFLKCPLYVVHVMSKSAMEEVNRAKLRGVRVIGETLTSAFALDDSHYYDEDFSIASRYVMSPPLRPKGNQEGIKNGLKSGVLSLIGTDHCVFTQKQKAMGKDDFTKIPNGINGIEDRMNVTWNELVNTGIITRKDYVRLTSTEAAQIFNIYPKKGSISIGADADICIMNPEKEKVITYKNQFQQIDYNVYEGYELKGYVDVTICRGKVVWENGKLDTVRGMGEFVFTPPYGKMYEGLEKEEKYKSPRFPNKKE